MHVKLFAVWNAPFTRLPGHVILIPNGAPKRSEKGMRCKSAAAPTTVSRHIFIPADAIGEI